jgi:two-component system response regulator AlgR
MATDLLRTIIVDDEPLAIERLAILCAEIGGIELIGTAQDGETALPLIAERAPDLVLLDIAMPGIDGVSMARMLQGRSPRPQVVFTTAFEGHALDAFDVAATDYLLKPVTVERLSRAFDRVRGAAVRVPAAAQSEIWSEFWVPWRSEMIRIEARSIDRVTAERDYMRLHVGARSHLLHMTARQLERRLDPARFLRIHRSQIVRRDFVERVRRERGGWTIRCLDGTELRVGRRYMAAVRALLDGRAHPVPT